MRARWMRSPLVAGLLLLSCSGATLGAQTGAIQGRVTLPQEIAAVARRPDIRSLVMPAPRDPLPRRWSVVYLEVGPREAFESTRTLTATIEQRDETFVPHVLAVEVGTVVDFPNQDETYHNVFSLSPAAVFDLGRYAQGQAKSVRFDRPGIVRVFCEIHSHMSAFVVVFSHRFFAVTDEEGRYRIEDVPAGTYRVVAWHERFGRIAQDIRVGEDGGDVNLDLAFQPR